MKLSEALKNGSAEEKLGNIRLTKYLTELVVDIEVIGWLDCSNNRLSTIEINQPIGDALYCSNNQLTSLEINQPIGDWLNCSNNQLTSLEINQPIGNWLNCSNNRLSTIEINQPIGGWFDCRNNQLTSLEINQPIGGSLDCFNNQLTSLEINQPIGGALYCSDNKLTKRTDYKRLHEGDSGDNWVYLDDYLFIYKHKSTRKEFTIYTSVFNNHTTKYLVSNGTHSAHARTIKQAILDIRFKQMDRNMDDYRNLGLDDKMSYEDAIVMYRVITGACSGGTEDFLNSHPELSTKKKYSVMEIIDLTSGQYGNDSLAKFFAKGERE